MLALLIGGADGKAHPAEEQAIRQRLAPQLRRLGLAGEDRVAANLADLLRTVGFDRTLKSIRAMYRMHEERVESFRVAVHVAFADGHLQPTEETRVAAVANALQLTDAELRAALR